MTPSDTISNYRHQETDQSVAEALGLPLEPRMRCPFAHSVDRASLPHISASQQSMRYMQQTLVHLVMMDDCACEMLHLCDQKHVASGDPYGDQLQ